MSFKLSKKFWEIHECDHLSNDLDKAGVFYTTIIGEEMKNYANAVHSKYRIDQSPKVEITSTDFPRNTISNKRGDVKHAERTFASLFSGQEIYYFRRWRGEFNSLHAKKIFCLDGKDFASLGIGFMPAMEATFCLPDMSFVVVAHFSHFYQYAGESGTLWDHADKFIQKMYNV